ncbi:hypothetical protein [Kitasatospora albolonga]|uniref:hypothetical protein n=1 Tax=Kitasatospora albolonga TaxID=68173 RepID=UPI003CD07234
MPTSRAGAPGRACPKAAASRSSSPPPLWRTTRHPVGSQRPGSPSRARIRSPAGTVERVASVSASAASANSAACSGV